jgi:hypothetical protein
MIYTRMEMNLENGQIRPKRFTLDHRVAFHGTIEAMI